MENLKNWQDFLPRGTKTRLAEKYNISRMSVTRILEREDVINHPDLVEEARKLALKGIEQCKKHHSVISQISEK